MTEAHGVVESRLHALASGVRPARVADLRAALEARFAAGESAKEALGAERDALLDELRSTHCGCASAEILEEWAWLALRAAHLARQNPPAPLRRLARHALALPMLLLLVLAQRAVKQGRAICVGVEHEEA